MFVYACSPIDFSWDLLPTTGEILQKIASTPSSRSNISPDIAHERMVQRGMNALSEAMRFGNDHDLSEQTRVLFNADPDNHDFSPAFVWKLKNNGTTIVVSEIAIPHLNEWLCQGQETYF